MANGMGNGFCEVAGNAEGDGSSKRGLVRMTVKNRR